MLIKTYFANTDSKIEFIAQAEIDAISLMLASESREDEARARGRAWTAGAVPFFARKLIDAMRSGKNQDDIEVEAVNAALFTWLCDSIYDGVVAEQFVQSDLLFTVFPSGAVEYTRVPKSSR